MTPDAQRAEVVRLKLEDRHRTQAQISTLVGVSQTTVSKILRRAGLGRPCKTACPACGGTA
ncbi:MAG: hypothetical protein QOG31_228 [Thermoplasmata archaeon]|jgi:predicted XRE-type DNA-binding protein|nr:hypothetical protein [Thermoplasmata archaeon]